MTIHLVDNLVAWSPRRWWSAAVSALAVFLVVGVPTDVVANPWFGRPVAVTWWSYPVLVATAVLSGLLLATYVRDPVFHDPVGAMPHDGNDELDAPGKAAGLGGVLSFFAVGCPTCNKLAVVALGTSGALDWFAPTQPLLAVGSLGLLVWALRARLRGERVCRIAP